MVRLLGVDTPPALPAGLDTEQLDALMELMKHARGRCSAESWALCASSAAACPLSRFGIAQMAKSAPERWSSGRVERRIINALANPLWDEGAVVDVLSSLAPINEVQVAVLEYDEIPAERPRHAVITLQLHGEGWTVPLDWRFIKFDSPTYDKDLLRAVKDLLQAFRSRYGRQAHVAGPPLLTLDSTFGEYLRMRQVIYDTVGEYGMRVSPDYASERIRSPLWGQVYPIHEVKNYFQPWDLQKPPRPLLISRRPSLPPEYVTPFSSGHEREYAIVAARVEPSQEPTGEALEKRVIEIRNEISRTTRASTTRILRLDAFSHQNSVVLRRQALLMSLLLVALRPPHPRGVRSS